MAALLADALDDIFRLFGLETLWEGDRGYLDVGEAEGAMAAQAREMNMAAAMACVVVVAHTIFLSARAIVDLVEQMGVGECADGAEERRPVDGRKGGLEVGQTEGIVEGMAHLTPDEQAHSSDAQTGIVEGLLVGDVEMVDVVHDERVTMFFCQLF